MGLPEDGSLTTSVQLEEWGRLLAQTPEWRQVKDKMVRSWQNHRDVPRLIADGRAALAEVGFDGYAMLGEMPEPYASMMTDEQREQAANVLEMYMLASVAHEVENGEPLPVLPLAGGHVSVEVSTVGDLSVPTVHVFATPLGDPEALAEQFLVKCYQTFPEAFGQPAAGPRDAEWFARQATGETCRQIALSDPSAGLAPEVLVSPDEYPDEVDRAEAKVIKAVQRYRKRWTKFVESLSTESD